MEKISLNNDWIVSRLDGVGESKKVDVPYDAMFYEDRVPDAPFNETPENRCSSF